jgi:hypothetical protein
MSRVDGSPAQEVRMLALAMFISICFVAVLFLLRFLLALNSEVSAERKRSKARVDHITAYQMPSGIRVQGTIPVLTMVHSNAFRREARLSHVSRPISIDARERNSQLKEA